MSGQTMSPLLEIKGLKKRFGSEEVLHGIDLTIERGERIAIIGPSGGGKSTLLRCMNLLEEPTEGTISYCGRVMTRHDRDVDLYRSRVGMVFQHFNLFPHMSVLRNIALAPTVLRRVTPKKAEHIARELLEQVGLSDKVDAMPYSLSGGQRQRVAIARALAMDPDLMLFDEPTSALDPETTVDVLDVMESLAREGMTMCVVTHEIAFARSAANRALFMDGGIITEDAPPEQLFAHPKTERAAEFFTRVLR